MTQTPSTPTPADAWDGFLQVLASTHVPTDFLDRAERFQADAMRDPLAEVVGDAHDHSPTPRRIRTSLQPP